MDRSVKQLNRFVSFLTYETRMIDFIGRKLIRTDCSFNRDHFIQVDNSTSYLELRVPVHRQQKSAADGRRQCQTSKTGSLSYCAVRLDITALLTYLGFVVMYRNVLPLITKCRDFGLDKTRNIHQLRLANDFRRGLSRQRVC